MSGAAEDRNRRLLRARDTIDGSYASPLDVAALARRIERAMELLRDTDRPVTEAAAPR